jgi:hypothetical protein
MFKSDQIAGFNTIQNDRIETIAITPATRALENMITPFERCVRRLCNRCAAPTATA